MMDDHERRLIEAINQTTQQLKDEVRKLSGVTQEENVPVDFPLSCIGITRRIIDWAHHLGTLSAQLYAMRDERRRQGR